MYRFINFSKNVFVSVELGFVIPLLPREFLYYYTLPVVRFIRLLGGLSALFFITGYYISFDLYIQICIRILATSYGLMMLILVIYSILFSVVLGSFWWFL